MSALFARYLSPLFDGLSSVRTFAAPDTRRHRGRAMFRTMLCGAGRRFSTLRRGELQDAVGWSEPEWVDFPAPVSSVLTYLVYGMADLDVLPEHFNVGTVEFRAGCEHPLLNRLLAAAAKIRQTTPVPLEALVPPVRGIAWLAGRVGRQGGAAMFEISGKQAGAEATERVAVLSTSEGEEIPVALAGLAAELWMRACMCEVWKCYVRRTAWGSGFRSGVRSRRRTAKGPRVSTIHRNRRQCRERRNQAAELRKRVFALVTRFLWSSLTTTTARSIRAVSSAVERSVYTREVGGSKPSPPTRTLRSPVSFSRPDRDRTASQTGRKPHASAWKAPRAVFIPPSGFCRRTSPPRPRGAALFHSTCFERRVVLVS